MIHQAPNHAKIDGRQFRTLLRISLINEWRRQWNPGSQKKRHLPVFFRSLIFYLIMGFSLGASLVTRASPILYTLLCYTYFMMMAGFAVILECSQVLMIPDDLDILSHRPVSSATFFWARVTHMLIFIMIFSTVLCAGPAVVSLFLYGISGTFPVIFIITALLSVLFTAALMMMFYTLLLRLVQFEKLKSLITVIQFFFILVLIFLYQWIARSSWGMDGTQFQLKDSWLRWLPPGWFAAMVESVYRPESFQIYVISISALAVSIVIFILGFRHLSINYLQDVAQQEAVPVSAKKGKSSREDKSFIHLFFSDIRIRHSETRAGFFLALQLLRRDRSVKLTLLPLMVMPFVILIWGIIESDIIDPFMMPAFGGGTNSMQLLPFFIAFLIFMTINGSVYIRDWEARWIFQSAPLESPDRYWRGARAALFTAVVSPFYLLLFIVFCSQFSWIHAIQHTVYLLLLGLVFMSFLSIRHRALPFSRKREHGERIGGMSFLLLIVPFQIAAVLIHLFAYQNQETWFLSAGLLFLLWALLEVWSYRMKNRGWLQFEVSD
ncbi:hypothetical protein JW835_00085 [bacterium]|nr:hypothetical protein [bacterium]